MNSSVHKGCISEGIFSVEQLWKWFWKKPDPAGNYMFKVNNKNTRTRCEICSKLAIKKPERRQWHRSAVFIVNSEHISLLVLVFLWLTLVGKYRLGTDIDLFKLNNWNNSKRCEIRSKFTPFYGVFVDFKHVFVCWELFFYKY